MSPHQALLLPAAALLLAGCIFVPVTAQVYDAGCHITSKQMQLAPLQLGAIQGCSNSSCAVVLAAAGATAAASLVVSGSIVVVGNVVYWFEKQGQCRKAG